MGGISTSTPSNTLFGTDGYLTVGGTDIGATIGDINVEWGVTHYHPDYAQARGPLSGSGIITEGYFRIVCTLAEHAWTNLTKVMGSIGSDSTGTSYKFGGAALTNAVEVTSVIALGVNRRDGKDWRATIANAYVELGGLTLSEKTETGLQVTFHGLYTTSAPTTLPGYIEIEK